MKLIYHEVFENHESELDRCVMGIATKNDVYILCPYISYNYLMRIINAASDYRIITDVYKLLYSNGLASRKKFLELIKSNPNNFRHFKNLHAKVIFSKTKALIGSANFTESGITKNLEISVFMDDAKSCKEILIILGQIPGK